MEEYIKKLKKTLKVKNLNEFYVMCDNKTFKPISGTPAEVKQKFKDNLERYEGRKVAYITLYVNPDGLKTTDFLFSIKIIIYTINDKGGWEKRSWNTIRIMYTPKELEENKFKLDSVHKFMKLCYNKILSIDALNGNWYTNVIKMLEKKNIDFDTLDVDTL